MFWIIFAVTLGITIGLSMRDEDESPHFDEHIEKLIAEGEAKALEKLKQRA